VTIPNTRETVTPSAPATARGADDGEPTPRRRAQLGRRAQLLATASVAYNILEAIIAVTAGLVAGSVALVGFGLDSVVEVSSGLIILWQFRHPLPQTREREALRLMALSFFALAAYVTVESLRALWTGHAADHSPVGIALAVASLAIMPFLSWAQRRTGRQLRSATVVADSTQTLLCTYLSAVLLAGLVLNATLGWTWADPVAGLVIAAVAVKEGREAWRGDNCCCPIGPVGDHTHGTADSHSHSHADGTGNGTGNGCGNGCGGSRTDVNAAGCADGCCTPADGPTASPPAPLAGEGKSPTLSISPTEEHR